MSSSLKTLTSALEMMGKAAVSMEDGKITLYELADFGMTGAKLATGGKAKLLTVDKDMVERIDSAADSFKAFAGEAKKALADGSLDDGELTGLLLETLGKTGLGNIVVFNM